MAKLYFRYGAMGASKTANLLIAAYNYKERGQNVIIFKPEIDNRDGEKIIASRIGIKSKVEIVKKDDNIVELMGMSLINDLELGKIECVLVDESQFLTKAHIEQLCNIVDTLNVPVICYGLRADFQGNLFEGSKWLMAWADSIEEIKTICWCGKKAVFNARLVDGKVVKNGDQIQIGGNESYISLCRKHWKEGATHY